MRIAFFVGSLDISGGTYVIYQHALFAASKGHDVTLVVLLPWEPYMLEWHPAGRQLEHVPIEELGDREFDLAVATWWKTTLELHRVRAQQYAYFVQSIESRFYPESEAPLRALVDATYDYPLPGFTEAKWVQRYLEQRHGKPYHLVRNGIRKDIYRAEGPRAAEPLDGRGLRVLVEGALEVSFKNVGRTLKLMRRAGVGETWLMTITPVDSMPGVKRVFSRIPIQETAHVYRSCDVLVKLSSVEGMFGPPLEMFHCGGTSVVYEVTGHDEYIENGKNALVIPQGDESAVVSAVRDLAANHDLLEHLKSGALETADTWPSWDSSSRAFIEALQQAMAAEPVDRAELQQRSQDAWAAYTRDEDARLARSPGLRLRMAFNSSVHRLPPPILRPIQKAKYILTTV